jgi:tetratricopeptide (TPR) repeat protein
LGAVRNIEFLNKNTVGGHMSGYLRAIHDTYKSVGSFLDKGLPDEGLSLIKKVSPEIQDNVIITYLKGVCLQETGHYEMAEEIFRQVIIEDPGFIVAAEALLYMHDNHLENGEKAYLCNLISMEKPESQSLREIGKNLEHVKPASLKPRKTVSDDAYTRSDLFVKKESITKQEESSEFEYIQNIEKKEEFEESSEESPILKSVEGNRSASPNATESTEKHPGFSEKEEDFPGDLLVDLTNKDVERKNKLQQEKEPEQEKSFETLPDIHLSPEEEAEIEREERLEESELLADSKEASKLKDLLKTLHERKHKDIEDDPGEKKAMTPEESGEGKEPFNTLTMARVYYKQGAYSSALKILRFLKKNTTDSGKQKEIEELIKTVNEKIEAEKTE